MVYKIPNMSEILNKEKENLFTVVSLFAGGGGSSTGYRMAGGKILAINEFVEQAQKTYHANYPNTKIFTQDVRELTGKMILDELHLKVGELDILDGSPPCSSFSMSGLREKGWGKEKKYSDNKSQDTYDLFYEYARILKELQPKVFVAENVKGLVLGCAIDTFVDFKNALSDCGYNVKAKVLTASDYGVPQNRQRLIFIGIRNDIEYDDFYFGDRFPKATVHKRVTVGKALESLVEEECDIPSACFPSKDSKAYALWKETNQGDSFDIAYEKLYGRRSNFSRVKLSLNKPSNTITTKMEMYHPTTFRTMSIKELTRITSLPDDYINLGTTRQQWERLGRMVPPLMMKAIAENIYNKILKDLK